MTVYEEWEPIIGLEVHTQLNTRTKLFSRTRNRFGDEPNTNIGLTDTGQPGTLPVLNKEAVFKAISLSCGLNAKIPPFCAFDRKSYFYPDSPRNYQITQFFHPIIQGGYVIANVEGVPKKFTIKEAHLEDDSGMLRHFSNFAGVDYNRAGVPLIEIVTDPCIFSAKEAIAFATALRSILIYLNVSTCNMEEGHMRMDVNVSVRKKGETHLRSKIEIKNLNSYTNMELAIEAEIKRQIDLYTQSPHLDPNEVIQSTTMRFDLITKQTIAMRSKVQAEDYRYFPEPDLPPLCISQEMVETVRRSLPELPQERHCRYVTSLELSEYNASLLVNDKALSDYFEQGLQGCKNPKALCNWITVEFIGRLKETHQHLLDIGLPAQHITFLVNLIEDKMLTGKIAKLVADEMVKQPQKHPKEIIEKNPDFLPVSDRSQIEAIVDEVLKKNAQSVVDYKQGVLKAFHYLIGQIMQASKGKASPEIVKEVLTDRLSR
jgi:aspartyl-tRNA(Asn)/glutamyl-tRNA(Gln) amidotransferase subunit B